ncbi:hypothetical protein [Streptomyces pseudovenezuelae]|uniref:Uncharacterized protein n=1 Tax=Streptomyces pseudovenezuelae TaxID=67350 RepID=A0ABT6LSH5_9ACTN|nr:hypothetical protein [Streptomyces pseudovenezuelae]MDH6219207.1 hypothetical protein [Streptomyces pseudovenezuelae]
MGASDEVRLLEITMPQAGSADAYAAMDSVIASLDRRRVVLHFAGGLLGHESAALALGGAAEAYDGAGACSVFLLQGGGLRQTLTRNLPRVLREAVFQIVLARVLWCVLGKAAERSVLGARGGAQSGKLPIPTVNRVAVELSALQRGDEPYATTAPRVDVSSLTAAEERWLTESLSRDRQLRSLGHSVREDEGLLMSSTRAEAAEHHGSGHGSRAVLELATGLLVRKVVNAVRAVIERFRAGTHHGLYPTVVEEILREFCLAHLGGAVWAGMKDEAVTAFRSGDGSSTGLGRHFLNGFIDTVSGPETREVTLVGHGSGVPLMNAFLAALDARRGLAEGILPADFRIRDVVAVAPMCTFPELASMLRCRNTAFERFRMFALTDEAEQADHLVPVAYPRSLLYFVSGVLERDANGTSAVLPLSGMARWYGPGQTAGGPEAEEVRVLADAQPASFIWLPETGPSVGASVTRSHSEILADPMVLSNLQALISS